MKISVITTSIRPKGLEITRKCLLEQSFKDFEWIVEINSTGKHDLNKAYNRAIKRARGELIVSLQDYINISPDALEKIWNLYQENKNTFFTFPVGKVSTEDYSENPKWDWRIFPQAQMEWHQWEIDLGSCPKEALYKIGGFDEEIDGFWSCDNVNVGCRAELAGYSFECDSSIRGIAFDHDQHEEHPFRKDFKPIFNNMRLDEFREGLKIDFLHS